MTESAQAFNLSLNCPASVLAARVRICRLEEPEGKTEKINETSRRGSRILKWGVNFCNNVIEPKPG